MWSINVKQYVFWQTYKRIILIFIELCSLMTKDHVYRMWKIKYSNIWPNQTIVSDQSELTILLCQPMIIYVCSEDDVNWVQRPSTFTILYTWSLVGGLSTPQLPDNYHYPNPTDNLGVQQAMRDLYQFPLAVYLCAFAGPKVFYTYSVW